jgi:anti-sigma regulatory factor (Ser/Thr protein kinase)
VRAERTFPGDPLSVPAARRFAIEALTDAAVHILQSVELMVSELATNGVRHGQTSFDLVVERTGDQIRIELTDRGGGTPTMRFPGPDEPTGRGLQIVDMLSERWGVERESASGKTVWFTLSAVGIDETDEEATRRFRSRGRDTAGREPNAWTFLVRSAPALW